MEFGSGSRQIELRVRALSMVFVGFCSSQTSQYAPNSALQCFVQYNVVPVIIFCGIHVSDTPILSGKALIHMEKKLISSIMILFGKCLDGGLVQMERALSLTTLF